MKDKIFSKILEYLESITLLLALFDLYSYAIISMLASISLLLIDLKKGIIKRKESVESIVKKYFYFPFILFIFYLLLRDYSALILSLILAGYASIRATYTYLKTIG